MDKWELISAFANGKVITLRSSDGLAVEAEVIKSIEREDGSLCNFNLTCMSGTRYFVNTGANRHVERI